MRCCRTGFTIFTISLLGLGLAAYAFAAPQNEPGNSRPSAGHTKITPRKSKHRSLGAGEHLLVEVLQRFANTRNEPVYISASIPSNSHIRLKKALTSIDEKTLRTLLGESGYEVSREKVGGVENAFWIHKPLRKPEGKRGSLVLRGRGKAGNSSPELEKTRAREASPVSEADTQRIRERGVDANDKIDAIGDASIRVFQQIDGQVSKFLVTFETYSKKEAEEIASAVAAILRSQRARK